MPFLESLLLIALPALMWFWFDSSRAHEAGVEAARGACASEGLQFLDDTVALASLRLVRDDDGRIRLRRIYVFEYSDTGDNRRRGSVAVLGDTVLAVNIGLRLVPPSRTLH